MLARSVSSHVKINVPSDVVWHSLTDATELTRWFAVDARVNPGVGGSIWISWGEGSSGEAPITAWDPDRRFEWTEHTGEVTRAVSFDLEPQDHTTVVRLTQSGIGAGPDRDHEFQMLTSGWTYFLAHLQWYLERHRGIPRDLIGRRDKVSFASRDAFARLLSIIDDLDTTTILHNPETCQAGFTIPSLNNAILFIEIEPGRDSCRGGFWLSTYGLGERLASVREHFVAAYRSALDLPLEE